MILDTFYNKFSHKYTISYINDKGEKSLLEYKNMEYFPTFRYSDNGTLEKNHNVYPYKNWNGSPIPVRKAQEKEGDTRFNERTFWFYDIPEHHLKHLLSTQKPNIYSFDIEVEVDESEFPEPSEAKYPILTISIVDQNLNTTVLGTKKLGSVFNRFDENKEESTKIQNDIRDYIGKSEYYQKSLKTDFEEKIKNNKALGFEYIYFEEEVDMLEYFLKFVQKVPVIVGWNSILFDWQYIQNRIQKHFADTISGGTGKPLKLSYSSVAFSLKSKRFEDMKGDFVYLKMPAHTLVLDMMDIVGSYDLAVMPQKENLSLDYIASESPVKLGKIKYDGNLQDLYEQDYTKYVFYNAVDSILVMLIDKCFRTLDNIYAQASYVTCPIGDAFSKIALSESLFWNYFNMIGPTGKKLPGFEDPKINNTRVVTKLKGTPKEENLDWVNEKLIGAYVKKPVPGLWNWVACCDFASLYPSTIITCNLSIENYIGKLKSGTFNISKNLSNGKGGGSLVELSVDAKKIKEIFNSPGGYTYEHWKNHNEQWLRNIVDIRREDVLTLVKAFKEEVFENSKISFKTIEEYSIKTQKVLLKHKYFISVNGVIYKNDKDYAFKIIQKELKANRGIGKYLKQHLDAQVLVDTYTETFKEDVKNEIDNFIFEIYKGKLPETIQSQLPELTNNKNLLLFLQKYNKEDAFMTKLINAVTHYTSYEQACKLLGNSMYGGSSHKAFFWFNMDLANDITGEARNLIHMMEDFVQNFLYKNKDKVSDLLKVKLKDFSVTPCKSIYSDTDSGYFVYDGFLRSIENYSKLPFENKAKIIVELHSKILNQTNEDFMREYYNSRGSESIHEFELETVASRGFWLNIKKRYSQSIAWKDGKFFKQNEQPIKSKGLELIKASYPTLARKMLKEYVTEILQNETYESKTELHEGLFRMTNRLRDKWCSKGNSKKDIDEICPSSSVNGYTKYILDDSGNGDFVVASKCPAHVRGLGLYNYLRNKYNLKGDPIYGGKCRVFLTKQTPEFKKGTPFTFLPKECPDWVFDKNSKVPIDKLRMFEKCVIDPINRILRPIGLPEVSAYENQGVQLSLF